MSCCYHTTSKQLACRQKFYKGDHGLVQGTATSVTLGGIGGRACKGDPKVTLRGSRKKAALGHEEDGIILLNLESDIC